MESRTVIVRLKEESSLDKRYILFLSFFFFVYIFERKCDEKSCYATTLRKKIPDENSENIGERSRHVGITWRGEERARVESRGKDPELE